MKSNLKGNPPENNIKLPISNQNKDLLLFRFKKRIKSTKNLPIDDFITILNALVFIFIFLIKLETSKYGQVFINTQRSRVWVAVIIFTSPTESARTKNCSSFGPTSRKMGNIQQVLYVNFCRKLYFWSGLCF